ncbi:MAG TPA: PEP-utilizing enzyme, partial [Dehalococcoidia bacterium]|nr:PEP-utilizing enzyme [Dehalococcoidia bacterium]
PPDPILTKFLGLGAEASTDSRTLNGNACSAGEITGTAKVVLSLDESDKLEPGDIMVCPMTMPPWTPLFGIVGAVVADAGGVLSHCAIVAREYGIPCVAGTRTGTQAIKDGMTIRVDGTAGTVEIIG